MRASSPPNAPRLHQAVNTKLTLQQGAHLVVPAVYVQNTLKNAVARGLSARSLLRAAGISRDVMSDEGMLVPPEDYCRLYALIAQAMQDELVGYGPARVPVGSWSMMCHAVIDCETLGEALERYCAFYGLFEAGFQPRFTSRAYDGCIEIALPDTRVTHTPDFFALELQVFQIHRLMNWLICEYVPFNTLCFSLPRPQHATWLDAYFVTTLLQFDANGTRLTFDKRFLSSRIKQDPAALRTFLQGGLLALFTVQYAPPSWTAQVKALIGRSLPDIPDFAVVADRFLTHPQTLRRRLAYEGTSFREIKVDVRREVALLLMQSSELSVEEISAKIGFSEPSAFARAFRSWTGSPPQKYRNTRD